MFLTWGRSKTDEIDTVTQQAERWGSYASSKDFITHAKYMEISTEYKTFLKIVRKGEKEAIKALLSSKSRIWRKGRRTACLKLSVLCSGCTKGRRKKKLEAFPCVKHVTQRTKSTFQLLCWTSSQTRLRWQIWPLGLWNHTATLCDCAELCRLHWAVSVLS